MATAQRQIRDGGELVPVILPQQAAPAIVRPIDPDILPMPVPSPARALQERLTESAADFRLPQIQSTRSELSTFVLCAVLLWGVALSSIAGLMMLAR